MTIVRFMDMHSGGEQKLEWPYIYIEAEDEDAARRIFTATFGRDSDNVTCDCCGEDYSVGDEETDDIAQASGYERECAYAEDGSGFVEAPRYPGGTVIPVERWLAEGSGHLIKRAIGVTQS